MKKLFFLMIFIFSFQFVFSQEVQESLTTSEVAEPAEIEKNEEETPAVKIETGEYDIHFKSQSFKLFFPDSDDGKKVPLIVLIDSVERYEIVETSSGLKTIFTKNSIRSTRYIRMNKAEQLSKLVAEKKCAVAVINYRKIEEDDPYSYYSLAICDVKSAIRFFKSNAEKYNIDTEKITVWGDDIDGYLAIMALLTPEQNFKFGDNKEFSSQVQAVVAISAPVNFYTIDSELKNMGWPSYSRSAADSPESKFLGFPVREDKKRTERSYWKTYKKQLPKKFKPYIYVQACTDDYFPFTQTLNFAVEMKQKYGKKHVCYDIIKETADTMADDYLYSDKHLASILAFLEKNGLILASQE